MMDLYHFTSPFHVLGCQREGLRLGMIPEHYEDISSGAIKIRLRPGFQWLTSNPNFDQSWAEGTGLLPYKRNAFRLTVRVPRRHQKHLFRWVKACIDFHQETARALNAYGDPQNWWIFRGWIRPSWVVAIDENPKNAVPAQDKINAQNFQRMYGKVVMVA